MGGLCLAGSLVNLFQIQIYTDRIVRLVLGHQYYRLDVARGNETTNSYLRRFAGTCPPTAACSPNRVQEHINVLPVRQEHVNRFWALARYREHVDSRVD